MLRSAAAKIAWVGRTASMVFGLALVLALLLGVASMALAGTGVGGVFNLGVKNTVNGVTQLVSTAGAGPNGPMLRIDNNGTGTAATGLEILTEAGKPPMRVNRATKVTNLNADRLDNLDSSDIGINGYEQVRVQSTFNSTAQKSVNARCPEGKLAIGGGAAVFPSTGDPNRTTAPIVLRYSTPDTLDHRKWTVIAEEIEAYGFSWWVAATVICATAP
jgi:hypothetical protein